MSDIACNLCGSQDHAVVFEAGVAQTNQIVKCSRCGLMFASPRTKEADVVSIEQYDPQYVLQRVMNMDDQRLDKERLQVKDYQTTLSMLAKHYPDRGELLEVGSGLGYLLDYFRKDGWNTTGVEPNEGLCLYAERQLGLNVIPKILEEAGIASGSKDVVIMMHVIEHVPDPVATLREVLRVLKPGGTFVLETPRYDTLMFRLLGRRERSLSCDGHIYFFTTETLAEMAKIAGFEILKEEFVGRSLTVGRLLYNLGVISKSSRLTRTARALTTKLSLNKFALSINVRDMERIYLRKPVS